MPASAPHASRISDARESATTDWRLLCATAVLRALRKAEVPRRGRRWTAGAATLALFGLILFLVKPAEFRQRVGRRRIGGGIAEGVEGIGSRSPGQGIIAPIPRNPVIAVVTKHGVIAVRGE